jgi:hypothetical protein
MAALRLVKKIFPAIPPPQETSITLTKSRSKTKKVVGNPILKAKKQVKKTERIFKR